MNMEEKSNDLLQLLDGFIAGRVPSSELQSFAWGAIDYFTGTPSSKLPSEGEFEPVFWYTIWQIQHLCDDLHEDDGTTERELARALTYMRGESEMPGHCVGRRPK